MRFLSFSVERFKGFGGRIDVPLAPIVVVFGPNNAGKSALLHAPWILTQPFSPGGKNGLLYAAPDREPLPALQRIAHRRSPRGFEAGFSVERDDGIWTFGYQATSLPDHGERQYVAEFHVTHDGSTVDRLRDTTWPDVHALLARRGLLDLHDEVDLIAGIRTEAQRSWPLRGVVPPRVGYRGEWAPELIASVPDIEVLDAWSSAHLGLRYRVRRDRERGEMRIFVEDVFARGEDVDLHETGTGTVQVLPVAAALLLTPRLPALFCIEHPELHLHPHAHRAVAELLVAARRRSPDTRLLVETHSDTLILRLRLAVVQERLAPEDVLLVYVETSEGQTTARPIRLNDRGVPEWWPKGVFAEAQSEFHEMRRFLVERDRG